MTKEFVTVEDFLDDNTSAAEKFVRMLYLYVLDRHGEPEGVAHNVNALGPTPTFGDAVDLFSVFATGPEATQTMARKKATPPPGQIPVTNVVSVGTHCLTAVMLKKIGLKAYSTPFDWIFSSIPMVAHCISDDFAHFLDKRHFSPIPLEKRIDSNTSFCDHQFYLENFGVRSVFNHYDISKDEVYDYYRRCVDRFRKAIRSGDRTLLIGIVPHSPEIENNFNNLSEVIKDRPGVELLLIGAKKANHLKFGFELIKKNGKNNLFELNMFGGMAPLEFTSYYDEILFERILDQYLFKARM